MTALRALLEGIVDYAGLFPPASLDMAAALRNYVHYRDEPAGWMLGRFVVPVARLDELRSALDSVALSTPIALSATAGFDPAEIQAARAFNKPHRALARVDAIEARATTEDAITRLAGASASDFTLFVELPSEPDPANLIRALSRAGASAKIRTGGVTTDSFPSAANVIRFIRRCLEFDVRFKATAGLHHPIGAEYPLTYETSSPRGTMFGYLNVFVAAALMKDGMSDADAVRVLEDQDSSAFEVGSESIAWRGRAVAASRLRELREQSAISFGSCSFREPVDELHALSVVA